MAGEKGQVLLLGVVLVFKANLIWCSFYKVTFIPLPYCPLLYTPVFIAKSVPYLVTNLCKEYPSLSRGENTIFLRG